MATIFARHYAPSPWNPQMLSGPCAALTLREWEVSVILCSLPPKVKQALLAWLIAPTDPGWPRPESFSRSRLPFTEAELRQPARPWPARASKAGENAETRFPQAGQAEGQPMLLWDEVKAIRQTLDMPLEELHGIARDLLLVAHGTRLRQVVEALGEPPALKRNRGDDAPSSARP